MKAIILLADAAQAIDGKLYVLGGGWSVIGPDPSPISLALKLEVPWTAANERHKWSMTLVTEDGEPVSVSTPEGEQQVQVSGEFEVGRPPGVKPGTPLDVPMAINFGPLPLPEDQRLAFRLEIDGQSEPEWQVAFTTRPLL